MVFTAGAISAACSAITLWCRCWNQQTEMANPRFCIPASRKADDGVWHLAVNCCCRRGYRDFIRKVRGMGFVKLDTNDPSWESLRDPVGEGLLDYGDDIKNSLRGTRERPWASRVTYEGRGGKRRILLSGTLASNSHTTGGPRVPR